MIHFTISGFKLQLSDPLFEETYNPDIVQSSEDKAIAKFY